MPILHSGLPWLVLLHSWAFVLTMDEFDLLYIILKFHF